MVSSLERAKRAKRGGAVIVSVNPLREAGLQRFDNPKTLRGLSGLGTQLADLHLPIRLAGDLLLFRAINALLIDHGWTDQGFVRRH